jgi:hypothetical protein
MTKSIEIFKGSKAGIWEVTGDAPTRVHGHLMWAVTCSEGHCTSLSHTQLQWGCPPSICDECEQEAGAKRAAAKIEERKLSLEVAKELAIAALEHLHSAPVIEQEGEVNAI